MRVCVSCAKHPDLQALIKRNGVRISRCRICGTIRPKALSSRDSKMRLLFKALVRYFYSESDYNPHLGGDGLGALFSQENPILHWRSSNNVMALETALLALQVPAYSDYRRGVSL